MRHFHLIIGVALTAATASCVSRPGVRDAALAPGAQWNAVLPAAASGVSGTLTFVRLDPPGQTRVIIALSGGASGAIIPWHVHYGQCGDDGKIVGTPGNYPPLVLGTTGRLDAVAQLPFELADRTRYFVHLHTSPSDMSVATCAALLRAGSATAIANVTR